jgi:hypothetical protein
VNGLRFGNLPTPFPDENCYSILCRFAVRRGQINSTQVIHDLFRNSVNIRLGSYLFKPFKLRDIQDWYGSNEIPIQYGANHSCYPYYTMFLSPLFAEKVKESAIGTSMTTGQAKRINGECGFARNHKQNLWYCPECVREDVLLRGETCWRRLPQMPGAVYCPIHGVKFLESGVRFREITGQLIPANYALNHMPEPPPERGNVYSERFIALARDIAWLLDKGFLFSDIEWIRRSFFEAAGTDLKQHLFYTIAMTSERENRFEDYLAAKIMKDSGKYAISMSISRQIGTILCIEDRFGSVEKFYSS